MLCNSITRARIQQAGVVLVSCSEQKKTNESAQRTRVTGGAGHSINSKKVGEIEPAGALRNDASRREEKSDCWLERRRQYTEVGSSSAK